MLFTVMRNGKASATFKDRASAEYHRNSMHRISMMMRRYKDNWTIEAHEGNMHELRN